MEMSFKNRKGNLFDLPLIFVLLLIISTFIILTFFVYDKIQVSLGTAPAFNNTANTAANTTTSILANSRSGFLSFDRLFFYGFIGLSLFVIISAFFINSHPIFFVFGLLMLVLLVTLTAVISNAYNSLETGSTEIQTTANLFPLMQNIMNNLPIWATVIGFLTLIILIMKPGGISGGGNI